MIFFNISENTTAINLKVYRNLALDSLYISTGNDVITFLRSAANRTNVFIWVMLGSRFLHSSSIDLKTVYSFGKNGQGRLCLVPWLLGDIRPWERFKGFLIYCAMHKTCLLLDPENLAQEKQPSSTHYINGWFRFSRKLLKVTMHKLTWI